jgi:hypothetical protein
LTEITPGGDPVDVVFLFDTTMDMAPSIVNIAAGVQYSILDVLMTYPNTQFAVAAFQDFPIAPYGASWDVPYALKLALTASRSDTNIAIGNLTIGNNGVSRDFDNVPTRRH